MGAVWTACLRRGLRKTLVAVTAVELACGGRGASQLFGNWEEGMASCLSKHLQLEKLGPVKGAVNKVGFGRNSAS